jgi:hypothetical protein
MADVITYLNQKKGKTWTPYYLGSSPNYIKALKNCSLNNLEEELLLGTDSYLETYEDDDGNTIINKFFCKNVPIKKNCYKIESIVYKDEVNHDKYYFEGSELIMKEPLKERFVDDTLVCDDLSIFNFDEEDGSLSILTDDSIATVRKDTLYYINNSEVANRIAMKETKKKYLVDGKIVLIEDMNVVQ